MATNLSIDPELIEQALAVSGERTKKAAVTRALEEIVYAYAKLGQSREELAAWHQYIPRLLDPRTRTVASMNMGEAEMRLGLVEDAREWRVEAVTGDAKPRETLGPELFGVIGQLIQAAARE